MVWTGEYQAHETCGSSDGLAIYEDDDGSLNGYCFVCNEYVKSIDNEVKQVEVTTNLKVISTSIKSIIDLPIRQIKERGISKETCEFYSVKYDKDKIYFPYFKEGKVTGYKIRDLKATDKKQRFTVMGDVKEVSLFGSDAFSGTGKLVVVTEGEIDALSIFQAVKEIKGKEYRILSLPNGVAGIKKHIEYLEQFESIYLCFDADEPGKSGVCKAASLFTPGKVSIVTLTKGKDANEALMAGKCQELLRALNSAKKFEIDGIVNSLDTWDLIVNKTKTPSLPYPVGWEDLQAKTHGIRLGELDTWTSGSGSGKTQVMRHLQYHILMKSKENIGVLSLEEPIEDTVDALVGMNLRRRIGLEKVRSTVSEKDLKAAWTETMGTGRIYFYDYFGSMDTNSLIKKIRYLAKSMDCKYIFIDHLGIIISEYASEGDERGRIDSIMTKLKNLTQELRIWICLVVHLRKREVGGKSFENGITPTLDDLRGSSSIKQLSNTVISLTRDQQAETIKKRNTVRFTVLKCRYSGDTGEADQLYYDTDTGWFTPLPGNNVHQIEKGEHSA